MEKDVERTTYLNGVGITEIRFRNDEVLKTFQNVKNQILTYLSARIPSGIEGEHKSKTTNQ